MLKLNIQIFGGRGASSGNTRGTKSFDKIKVGDKFQQRFESGSVYNIEVTRKNKNSYTVQATSVTENGRTTQLYGPNWVNTLVNKRTKNTPKGYISMNQTSGWKRS